MDIQQRLDEWLAGNPAAQKYVTKLHYVPEPGPVPPDVTHLLRLSSHAAQERALRIGLVGVPEFVLVLDALLAMIATQPQG